MEFERYLPVDHRFFGEKLIFILRLQKLDSLCASLEQDCYIFKIWLLYFQNTHSSWGKPLRGNSAAVPRQPPWEQMRELLGTRQHHENPSVQALFGE